MVLNAAVQVNLGRSGCATEGEKVSEPRIVPVGTVAIFYLRDAVLGKWLAENGYYEIPYIVDNSYRLRRMQPANLEV